MSNKVLDVNTLCSTPAVTKFTGFLPMYQALLSCMQLYHIHPDLNIVRSRNVHRSKEPMVD